MTTHTSAQTLHPHRADLGPFGPSGTAWMRVPFVIRKADTIDVHELAAWADRIQDTDPDLQDLFVVSGDLLRLYQAKGARSVGIHCHDCDIAPEGAA